MDIRSLAYLGFESPKYDEWREFAPDVLGLQAIDEANDDTTYLKMDSRHHRIAIRPGPMDELSYIGWEVPNEAALEVAAEELRVAGYEVEEGDGKLADERRVGGLVAVIDPVGFRHEISYGAWYQPHTFYPGRPHDGFVGEEMGIGHVVVAAPMTDHYLHFLTGVLGFKVYAQFPAPFSGKDGPRSIVHFVRCNSRTHCMAILPIPGRQGVHHFMIETKSLQDVGIAYDLLEKRGLPLTITLGSHTIDPVVSFYFRTPSGFDMEYGYGGIEVDDSVIVGKPNHSELWGHKATGIGLPTTIRPLETGSPE